MGELVKTFNIGRVRVTIWKNQHFYQNKQIETNSVQVQKRYFDGKEWKETDNFNMDEIPKLVLAVSEAYKFLSFRDKTQPEGQEGTKNQESDEVVEEYVESDNNEKKRGSLKFNAKPQVESISGTTKSKTESECVKIITEMLKPEWESHVSEIANNYERWCGFIKDNLPDKIEPPSQTLLEALYEGFVKKWYQE